MTLRLNKTMRNKDVQQLLQSYEPRLRNIPPLSNGHNPTEDALVKWCLILESLEHSGLNYRKILDAGCGPSNLSIAIRNIYTTIEEIVCIERDSLTMSRLLKEDKMCQCLSGDFFDEVKKIQDNSLDLIVDACSVTHFRTSTSMSPNDGCFLFAKEATRILREDGVYVTASDFSIQANDAGEFVDVESMIKSYELGGLKLLDSDRSDLGLDDAFISNKQYNLGVVRLVFKR